MNHDTRPAPNSVSATVARPAGRRPPRPLLTYIILSAGVLTSIAALGAYRHARMPATSSPVLAEPAPIAVVPPPASVTPGVSATPAPVQVAAPAQKARPRVDLVFALDTTGSMGGLIDGAKRKIWSLASFVAQGQPTPDLRVGLVAYRDVGDAYVTRVYDLDADLDRVYKRLHALRAEGGGDTPEHVARALDEAVHKMSWSANAEAVKVIYLVGDAPPHTDYRDGYDYARAARAAAQADIQVHTILCGDDPQASVAWRKVALLGHGEFMAIHQDGGVQEEHSRYDAELAKLHDRLADTTIAYGAAAPEVAAATKEALKAPASVKAARAGFMARNDKAVGGKGDLVEALASGSVKLADVQAELPKDLQAMAPRAQQAVVEQKKEARKQITDRINELSRLRRAELETSERAAEKAGVADGFDVAAKKALRATVRSKPAAAFDL
jgi:hypothetical protein